MNCRYFIFGIILLVCSSGLIRAENNPAFEVPYSALRYLADANTNPCSICVDESQKKAYSILNKILLPGTEIRSTQECPFVKAKFCGTNEFALKCYTNKILFKTDPQGKKSYLPRIVFRIHTGKKHLVGIEKNDFTDQPVSGRFKSIKKGGDFSGILNVVEYRYGDGRCFIFDKKRNLLVVQCRITEMH